MNVAAREVKSNRAWRLECQALRGALRAIAARINGEFDNRDLRKYGPLFPDPAEDVLRIIREALNPE